MDDAAAFPPPGVVPYRPGDGVWLQRVKVGDANVGSDIVTIGAHRFRIGATLAIAVTPLDAPPAPVEPAWPPSPVPPVKAIKPAFVAALESGDFALSDFEPVMPRVQLPPDPADFQPTQPTDQMAEDSDEVKKLRLQLELEREKNRHNEADRLADANEVKPSILVAAPSRQWFAYSTWVLIFTAVLDTAAVVLPMLTDQHLMSATALAYTNIALAAVAQIAKMLKQTIPVTSQQKADLVESAAALPMKPGERNIQVHVGGEAVASTPKG